MLKLKKAEKTKNAVARNTGHGKQAGAGGYRGWKNQRLEENHNSRVAVDDADICLISDAPYHLHCMFQQLYCSVGQNDDKIKLEGAQRVHISAKYTIML